MFIGRQRELNQLEMQYQSQKFEFAVIYGRKHMGKTSLITKFIKDKKSIFFTGIESNQRQNLINLSQAIVGLNENGLEFNDYQKALEYIFKQAENERIVFIIDEYPYLANAYPAISSILQLLIDQNKDTSQLFLILCGSSLSFMEEQVLGYQSPLYGRRTSQYKINPFTYFETATYLKNFNNEDKAILYGLTSGIPLYLSLINDKLSIKDNIINHFLVPNGYLYEEPTNLIKQECREPQTYNAIIQAIANGYTRLSEIATHIDMNTSVTTIYLNRLISLGIIKKEHPIYKPSKKKTIYLLDDSMFVFWYKFIPKYVSMINMGMGEFVYQQIERYIPKFMGFIFENICRQYLWKMNMNFSLPIIFTQLGRWWGNDASIKQEVEIDILAYNESNEAIIGECKWKNEKMNIGELEKLMSRAKLFPFENLHYYLFSKSGFTSQCIEAALNNKNIHLITFEDINNSI